MDVCYHPPQKTGTQKSLRHFFLLMLAAFWGNLACNPGNRLPPGDPDHGGLFLPGDFDAVVVVDSLPGRARHLAVNTNGDIYVKLRFPDARGGNAALRDQDHDGKADIIKTFDDYEDKSSYGTGMRIHNGYLYFSSVTRVYRQKLTPGKLIPTAKPELLLTDTQRIRQHDTKPIAFDDQGHMYVPFGAPSDCCQVDDRTPLSPGMNPCPILEDRGGIWRFDADRLNQTQKDGYRYATGFRSVVALEWNHEDHSLYSVIHGRDYLHNTWPGLFSPWQGAVLPSEVFLKITDGTNAGWPYYYYDQLQGSYFLNPEYGGDGKKRADTGLKLEKPLVAFLAHYAPDDLLFYTGQQFPDHYRHGAFIAFHGSTSSAPYPQSGYFVAFVPFRDGVPYGPWEVFCDGFAGKEPVVNVSDAVYRPVGLAMGPDGSLYVCDSEKGKIWRIMFKGNQATFGKAQLAAMEKRKETAPNLKTPDEKTDILAAGIQSEGANFFELYCSGCHQENGKGDGSRFPPLYGSEWVRGNKDRLIAILLNGKEGQITVSGHTYENTMPKMDMLSDEQIARILTYIRQNFGNQASAVAPEEVARLRKGSGKKK